MPMPDLQHQDHTSGHIRSGLLSGLRNGRRGEQDPGCTPPSFTDVWETQTAAVFAEGGVKLRQFSPVGLPPMLIALLLT